MVEARYPACLQTERVQTSEGNSPGLRQTIAVLQPFAMPRASSASHLCASLDRAGVSRPYEKHYGLTTQGPSPAGSGAQHGAPVSFINA